MRPSPPWLWFILIQPLGLLIYYICGLAETNRSPFDLPEAESELVAGYLTEYSGLRWAMFFLGEYGNMASSRRWRRWSSLADGPAPARRGLLDGTARRLLRAGGLQRHRGVLVRRQDVDLPLRLPLMVRATLPRLRADQLMRFAWLVLIPLTLFNILLTGALLLIPTDTNVKLIVAGVANWLLLFIFIFGFRRLTGVNTTGSASELVAWAHPSGAC